jgi:hypothetical protein
MSCAAVLQKYDAERDEAQAKFDLDRDEAQRRFMAAMLGVEIKDAPSDSPRTNGRKQTMTQEDIMRNYGK